MSMYSWGVSSVPCHGTSSHEGPVWQVAWAHPKFGSILASCSYDGTVIVWQETKGALQYAPQPSGKQQSTWTKLKVHRVHESSGNGMVGCERGIYGWGV